MDLLKSVVNYLLNILILLLGFLTAPIIFPLYYALKNTKYVKKGFLWLYGDDEDGIYGAQYWKDAKGIKKDTFWTAYRWAALRNPAWNLHTIVAPERAPEREIRSFGKLYKNLKRIDLYNMAVIHHVNENGEWNNNSGKYISMVYSILGYSFYFFEKNKAKYFRFSTAFRLFNIGRKSLFFEMQIGTSRQRHLFKIKIKFKEVY